MTTMLLKVPVTEDGEEYFEVEVDRRHVEAITLAAGRSRGGAWSTTALSAAMAKALPALRMVAHGVRSAAAPDEISVEVGLAVGGETGLIFTKGTMEATFTLSLTWRGGGDSAPPAR
ncbi:CU044_2847 family protein [Micromonospora sp. FIMYZ51]|uniref:CU044_2847 family protein n=1 Tax=Micromonospora sp. FIMYZ51 TaxID=3051832 RepID=UPI00311DB14F